MAGSELQDLAAELLRHAAWHEAEGLRRLPVSARAAAQSAAARAAAGPVAAGASAAPQAAGPAAARPSNAPPPLVKVVPAPAPAAADAPAPGLALAQAPAGPVRTLDEVRRELGDCKRCKLCSGRTQIVYGVGNPKAELVFVGEGPGAEEDAQGVPFVGKAGQLLTKMIEAMKFGRDDVYICNVVKCRPPGNRNPEPDEIAACEPFLKAQLAAIRPKVIVALGKFAAQTLLRDDRVISRMRGQWRTYEGIELMPTFHPAYLLRNPNDKKLVWADLQEVMKRLGKK